MQHDGGGGTPLDNLDLERFRKLGRSGGRNLGIIALLILLAVLLVNSFYTIKPEEVGIILRLGEYRGRETNAGPGLHFKLPFVDQLFKVPVERQLKAEFGFRTEAVAVRSQFRAGESERLEASMLTGDLNAAMVEWVVQYRIVDAYQYLFRVRNVESTFRDMSEAVMRKVVGDRTVNEVLTVGRSEIEDLVKVQLQELAERYETGIRVDQVVLQSINPPDPVKPSFNEVNQAEQELERRINEAQAQYNRVIPRAEGEARQTIEQAEGYATNRVNRSEGDAARFEALFAEYRRAPEVTRKRIYLETMRSVLQKAGKNLVVDDDLEGLVPMLDVQRLERAAEAAAAQQTQGGN